MSYASLDDQPWYMKPSGRPTGKYDPGEWLITSILRFRGTAIQMVLFKPAFWLLVGLHYVFYYVDVNIVELPHFDPAIMIGLPASLLIFVVVFYGGNCYTRYYELFNHLSEINALVYDWILQTSFIYEDAERTAKLSAAGRPMGETERKKREWMAVRRFLAALHLLFYTIDPEEPAKTCCGRIEASENPFLGAEIHDSEWQELIDRQLLRPAEVERLKNYKGVKFIIPIKWALSELATSLRPEDRMKNQSRNYEALQEIAASFQKKALKMLSLQGQPVPLAYFHLLKLMLVFVNALISYSIIGVFEHQLIIGYVGFIFIITALLGLQEIAISMSDPFGKDDADFDIEQMCRDAYGNAVEYMRERSTRMPTFKELEDDSTLALNPLLISPWRAPSPGDRKSSARLRA